MARRSRAQRAGLVLVFGLLGLLAACTGTDAGTDVQAGGAPAGPDGAGTVAADDGDDRGERGTTAGSQDPTTTAGDREARSDDERFQAYVDALLDSFGEGDELWTRERYACMAPRWVEALGVDELQAAGIEPDDLAEASSTEDLEVSRESAEAMTDAVLECGVDLYDVFIGSASGSDPEIRACLEETITEEQVREMFVESLIEPQRSNEIYQVMNACLLPDGSLPAPSTTAR